LFLSKSYQRKAVVCIKCGAKGTLTLKTSITKGKRYEYFYVQHTNLENYSKSWCYLGKYDKLPTEYKKLIRREDYTQRNQNIHNSYTQLQNPKRSSDSGKENRNQVGFCFHKHFKSPVSLFVSKPRRLTIWLLTRYGLKNIALAA